MIDSQALQERDVIQERHVGLPRPHFAPDYHHDNAAQEVRSTAP